MSGRKLSRAFVAIAVCSGCVAQEGSAPSDVTASGAGAATFAPAAECSPTGAHAKHGAISCATCHFCAGTVSFDPAGGAVAAGQPAPSFDAVAKTCASIACHGMYSGTFGYWFQGGDGNAEYRTVTYQGLSGGGTPSWYDANVGCAACHGVPPQNFSWHTGHGGGTACSLCHPDVNATGTAITNPALHGNGVPDVVGQFKPSCFGCH